MLRCRFSGNWEYTETVWRYFYRVKREYHFMTIFKKKRLIWILSALMVIVLTAGFVGYRMYNKPHRDVQHIKAIPVAALKLVADYETNEALANNEYLDKVLEITGEIIEISKNQKGETVISLDGTGMGTVRCTMEGAVQQEVKTKTQATVRGICTGYLTDVIVVRGINQRK